MRFSLNTHKIVCMKIMVSVLLFASMATLSAQSWGDLEPEGSRESLSTAMFNPGFQAFDGSTSTAWTLSAGQKSGWVERYWPVPRRLTGAALSIDLPASTQVQLWYIRNNNWVPIAGAVVTGPQNGIVTLTFPSELPQTSKVLVTLQGVTADQAKVWEVSFQSATYPTPYGKILPKSYSINQPEYINLKASRLWDGINKNSWFQPLWNNPTEIFQTDSANRPDSIFPPFNENPSKDGEIIWELDGPYTIQTLKAHFIQDWRSVKFEFWNGTAWANAQEFGTNANHDQDTPWQHVDLANPVLTSRIRITFPKGWSKASYIGELEVWGTGWKDRKPLALPIAPIAADGSAHFTFTTAAIQDYTIEVTTAGNSTQTLGGVWNGVPFSVAPWNWIGEDTVYHISIAKESLQTDTQFLKLSGPATIHSVVLTNAEPNGEVNLGWPYSDGQFSNTVAGPGTVVPSEKTHEWSLGNTYQLEKLRVFGTNSQLAQFRVRRVQDGNWISLTSTSHGAGWWEFNLQHIRADKLAFDSPVAITLDEVKLYGTATNDTKVGMEIWWPDPKVPVTSADNENNSIIGWKGRSSAQVKIGDATARESDNLFWMPLNQLGIASDEEKSFLVTSTADSLSSQQTYAIKWKGKQPVATFDQTSDLVATIAGTLKISGTVTDNSARCVVNGIEISIQSSIFTTLVPLVDGFQTINVQIWDKHRKKLKATLTKPVYKVVGLPVIRFDQSFGDLYSQSTNFLLSGVVGNGTGLNLSVNGTSLALSTNSFATHVSLHEGTNQFTFVLKDSLGRETEQTLTVYRDAIRPVISILTPTQNQYFNNSNVTLSASGGADAALWWRVNNGPWIPGITPIFSRIWTLPDGFYSDTIQAQDRSGNVSLPVTVSYCVDTNPPLPFSILADVSGWTNNNQPTITFGTTDATSGIDHFEYAIDGGTWTLVTSPFKFPTIADGIHAVQVRAIDKVANVQVASTSFQIDTSPPLSPDSVTLIPGTDNLSLRWYSVDDGENFQSYRIERSPAWPDGIRTISSDSYGRHIYSDSNLSLQSIYEYRIWAVDRAGNQSPKSPWLKRQVGIADVQVNTEGPTVVEYQGLVLSVPQNAVNPEIRRILVTEVPIGALLELPPNPLVSSIYEIRVVRGNGSVQTSTAHADLNKNVTISIAFDPAKIPPELGVASLKPFYFDPVWGKWFAIQGGFINPIDNTVTFETNHFTELSIQASKEVEISPQQLRDVPFSPFATNSSHGKVDVSTQYGTVSTDFTELVLPGKNNFDLVLRRVYSTTKAMSDRGLWANTSSTSQSTHTPGIDPSKDGDYPWYMGEGWRLQFPSLNWRDSGVWIKDLDGRVSSFSQAQMVNEITEGDKRIIEMVNHEGSDTVAKLVFKKTRNSTWVFAFGWTKNAYEFESASLQMADGRHVFFDNKGRVTSIYDRAHLNTITFEYNGDMAQSITDSMNRKVSFSYIGNKIGSISVSAGGVRLHHDITYKYGPYNDELVSASDIGQRNWVYTYEYFNMATVQRLINRDDLGLKKYDWIDPRTSIASRLLVTVSGPGIGETRIGYQKHVLKYDSSIHKEYEEGRSDEKDPFWHFSNQVERITAASIAIRKGVGLSIERSTSYTFDLQYGGFSQFYVAKSRVNNGKTLKNYDFLLSTNARQSLSDAPEAIRIGLEFDVGYRSDSSEVISLPYLTTSSSLTGEVYETQTQTWDPINVRLLRNKLSKSADNFIETAYLYDNWGNVTSEINTEQVGGRQTSYKKLATYYGVSDLLTSTEMPNGASYNSPNEPVFSARKNLVASYQKIIEGKRSESASAPTATVNEFGAYKYDEHGQVSQAGKWTGTEWITTGYQYHASTGELTKITSPLGQVTDYAYDYGPTKFTITTTKQDVDLGNGTSTDIVSKAGHETLSGNNTWLMDGRRLVTEKLYDDLNRVWRVQEPSDGDVTPLSYPNAPVIRGPKPVITTVSYDDTALTSTVTLPLGGTSKYSFDELGRLKKIEKTNAVLSPLQIGLSPNPIEKITTKLHYDGYDQLISLVGPVSNYDTDRTEQNLITTFDYDNRGRLISSHAPGAISAKTMMYNDAINQVTTIDEMGNHAVRSTDWNGKVLKDGVVVGGEYQHSQTFYDGSGRTIANIDPNGNVSSQFYNPQGVLQKEQKPSRSVQIGANSTVVVPEIQYIYNKDGYLTQSSQNLDDGRVNLTTFTPNGLGSVLTSTSPVTVGTISKSIVVSNVYDAAGNRTQQTTGYLGETQTTKNWTYDAHSRVLKEIDEETHATTYEYDVAGNRTSTIDPRNGLYTDGLYQGNFRLTSRYDQLNRLIEATSPGTDLTNLPKTQFLYDGSSNALQKKKSGGQIQTNTFTLRNSVATEKVEGGTKSYTTSYTYDDAGRKTQVLDPSGRITYFHYDAAGRVVKSGNDVQGWNIVTYDPNGNMLTSTDGRNHTTTNTYSPDNQVATSTDAQLNTSTTFFDRWGRKVKTQDRENNLRTYSYDEIGRLVSETTPWSANLSYIYDAWGQVKNETDARGTVITREISPAHNITKETAVNGTKTLVTEYEYDEAGDRKSATSNGVLTTYNTVGTVYSPNPYGLLNRTTRTISGTVLGMDYSYDSELRLTGVVNPNSVSSAQSVTYGYNTIGQLDTMPGWINGAISYYNQNLISGFTMANGVSNTIAYDSQDRVSGLSYTTDATTLKSYAFTYDKAQNLAGKTVDSNPKNIYTYDTVNQLVGASEHGWFQKKPESVNAAYTVADRDYTGTAVLSFPVQPIVAATDILKLDTASRSFGVDLGQLYGVNKIELHPDNPGHRVKRADISVYASATNDSATYTKIEGWTFAKNALNGSLTLSFPVIFEAQFIKINTIWDDRNGANISVDNATFKKPARDLIKVWVLKDAQTQAYDYDKNGNRLSLGTDGVSQAYTYYRNPQNTGNLSWVRFDGNWYYQYDQAGNTIVKAKALVGAPGAETPNTLLEYWNYGWDLNNRLTEVKKNGQPLVSYLYDAENYRVQRSGSDGTTTIYTYGRSGALTYQKNLTTGLERSFTYLNDTLIGWTETKAGIATRFYVTTDQLGSVAQVLSADAANPQVLWQSEYTAFGTMAGAEGVATFDGMYTGKDIDPDTGLTYHWNRWRSEDGSRFWSEDPARDGSNWYAYAGNSPLVFTDPTGLEYVSYGGWFTPSEYSLGFSGLSQGLNSGDAFANTLSSQSIYGWGSQVTGPMETNSVSDVPQSSTSAFQTNRDNAQKMAADAAEFKKTQYSILDQLTEINSKFPDEMQGKLLRNEQTWANYNTFGTGLIYREHYQELYPLFTVVNDWMHDRGYGGVEDHWLANTIATSFIPIGAFMKVAAIGNGAKMAIGAGGKAAEASFGAAAGANGMQIIGTQGMPFRTPFGLRFVDFVLKNPATGSVGGVEIKSSIGAFTRFDKAARQQAAADWWINNFGANGVGKAQGLFIDNTIKILWE